MDIVEIKCSAGIIKVEIIKSKRKTMALQAYASGRMVLRVPKWVTKRETLHFLDEHADWIEKASRRIPQKSDLDKYVFPDYESLTRTQRNIIRAHFFERLEIYAPQMGVIYNKISIKNQKGRWGSCSSLGNLNFNYRLHYLPQELMDYVVVHELAHRIHMNHSKEFWNVVALYIPDFKERRNKLQKISIGRVN